MEQDYFKTLPSGYIEYIDKLMNYGDVGSDSPIYRIIYSPPAFLFNMVPMGGEGHQLEFMTQLYEKYNIEEFVNNFFEKRNEDIDIIGHHRGFNRWSAF
jgi:hypothetical protein